ncbi:gamma-glutamyl-gamma-aminobutyrate hydrolase family protein [Haloterrigena sp. SYSU A121-1]|uniref:Gamma-glutamyl-gamma-aminobutyrate hydrolase family protein n=1 Tax=Haloterrigena gelatinilytica TaxID=2741724 RepID=A0A8J8GJ37_9EURY|nr:type 1 glutamine amidotransferase [Haloterrigena gelatinilytica]NUB90150.1 gamma-glutamyl-gamma-aminobutyrate hydrolase family protein [Haloterrigena gelatinilytica]
MDQLRIAVLNAAHRDENTTRNFRRELDASLAEFDATEGEVPDGFDYDGAVVTGSRSSVYWDDEWMRPIKEWVGDAIDRGMPFLGVCWGHQLLADVLGGTVEDMGAYEVGYSEIEHYGESRLFDDISREFTAFTSHSDEVSELPPGAEPLAENHYSNHGFRKDRVFGVQFHPEYDAKTARELVGRKDLSDDRRQSVLEEITEENYQAACEAKLVFDNFLEFVREVRTENVAVAAECEDATATVGRSD